MITSQSGRNFYTAYNVASRTYVYNSDEETDAEAGWVTARGDYNILAVCVATLSATTLSYRVEGRWSPYNRPVEIYQQDVTAAHDIDQILTITEKVKEIRVGVKLNNTATPNVFYSGLLTSDIK